MSDSKPPKGQVMDTKKSTPESRKRTLSQKEDDATPTKIAKIEGEQHLATDKVKRKSRPVSSVSPPSVTEATAAGVKRVANNVSSPPLHSLPKKSKSEKKKSEADSEKERKKQSRKRMKSLLQAILDQMEFYFGDANLSKDRFLREQIDRSPDGYVNISVFGNFNKLQSFDKDGISARMIVSALKSSKMLQLNDSKTKVRRITPIKEISQEEMDNRTVYVEYLPSLANHAWMQTVFSQCGKVLYVSLPTYKTGHSKGFAFVEFETADEANRACTMLNNPLPAKAEEKPGKFPKGNKTLSRLQRLVPPKSDQDSNEENISDDQKPDSEGAATNPSNKKKKKKGKKRKADEEVTEESISLTSGLHFDQGKEKKKDQQAEGKKKKKKKKKKPVEAQSSVQNAEGEKSLPETAESLDVAGKGNSESVSASVQNIALTIEGNVQEKKDKVSVMQEEKNTIKTGQVVEDLSVKKRKKKHKKKKGDKKSSEEKTGTDSNQILDDAERKGDDVGKVKEEILQDKSNVKLSRKERKLARQADIRRKKSSEAALEKEKVKEMEAESGEQKDSSVADMKDGMSQKDKVNKEADSKDGHTSNMQGSEVMDTEAGEANKGLLKSDGKELTSILKSKKGQERKRVEFDPVPITTEFVKGREIRRRKKPKKDKLNLRVITKREWLSLKAEYIAQQKSHMAALKESLRELRQQENEGRQQADKKGQGHVDLEDVFGTKRLKPSQDVKMAHVESLKFTPNVIVQWKCSHDMHRDKIRTMFKEMSGDSIAYIDAKEEAKSGYIRFKDEASAEEFTKLSRQSTSFMTRILPADQQQAYWDKANKDRMEKLGRKKHEKGAQRIARKVFERNRATFHQKPSRVVFNDDDDNDNGGGEGNNDANENNEDKKEEGVKEGLQQTEQGEEQNTGGDSGTTGGDSATTGADPAP